MSDPADCYLFSILSEMNWLQSDFGGAQVPSIRKYYWQLVL